MSAQGLSCRNVLAPLRWGQFVMVMGWSGLYFCVAKLEQALNWAPWGSMLTAGVDVLVFVVLLIGLLLRVMGNPRSLAAELGEPLGLSASAAFAVALILLSRVLLGLPPSPLAMVMGGMLTEDQVGAILMRSSETMWLIGAGLEVFLSLAVVWVYAQLWRHQKELLTRVSPVMFIPAAGNVLVALSGVPLGHVHWSMAQFILGLFLWPMVCVLLYQRVRLLGPLPKLAQPSWFIALSPPSVVGLSLWVFDAPVLWVWLFWLLAFGVLCCLLPIAKSALSQSFSNGHWALSFPLAAWCSLSLSLTSQLSKLDAGLALGVQAWGVNFAQCFFWALTGVVMVLLLWLSAQSARIAFLALRTKLRVAPGS